MADQQPHTTQNVAPKASPQGSIATGTGTAATATTGGEQPGAKGTVSGTGSGMRGTQQPAGAAQQGGAQDQRMAEAQDQAREDQRAQEERPKPTPAVSGVSEGDKVRVRGADGKEFEATVSRVWSPQYVRVEWQDEKGGAQMLDNVSNGGDEQRYKDVVLSKV